LQQEPGLTTAQLLEQWRDLPEHSILMTLAAWEHQIEPEQLSQEFIDTFYFIEDQYLQKQLDELALRAKLNQLSKAEWHKYNLLLQALKSKKPKLAT
jgi:DNA primase